MGFVCENEIEIEGCAEAERRKAASMLSALDIIDEESLSEEERPGCLELRFQSVDGLPEEEAMALAAQFPGLAVRLAYFSKDGEFYGFSRSGPEGDSAESADLEAADLDDIGKRHNGDGIAFVREKYGLRKA